MDLTRHPDPSERRKHARKNLRVGAQLFRGSEVIQLTTRNISIGGFYSVCERPFTLGEYLDSVLEIGGLARGVMREAQAGAHLHCRVRVLRVEPESSNSSGDAHRYGVAFAIESYRVAVHTSDGEM